MKKGILILIYVVSGSMCNVYVQGIFESESPWEETVRQDEENMDRGGMKSALKQNTNKNIRGGVTPTAGQHGVQDVPIDSGILVVSAGLFLLAVAEIRRQKLAKKTL